MAQDNTTDVQAKLRDFMLHNPEVFEFLNNNPEFLERMQASFKKKMEAKESGDTKTLDEALEKDSKLLDDIAAAE